MNVRVSLAIACFLYLGPIPVWAQELHSLYLVEQHREWYSGALYLDHVYAVRAATSSLVHKDTLLIVDFAPPHCAPAPLLLSVLEKSSPHDQDMAIDSVQSRVDERNIIQARGHLSLSRGSQGLFLYLFIDSIGPWMNDLMHGKQLLLSITAQDGLIREQFSLDGSREALQRSRSLCQALASPPDGSLKPGGL